MYRYGRLHPGDLAHWLRTHVAFSITGEQLSVVHNFLDNGGHYYIGRDAFVKAVGAPQEADEEEQEEDNEPGVAE